MKILAGKVALVTGAGRGIGRGIAMALAAAGARVVVNDLGTSLGGELDGSSPAANVVREIELAGGEAYADTSSVAEYAATGGMIERIVQRWGRVDILVHVAGILRDRMIFNMSETEWDAVMDVHLNGLFNLMRPVTALMRQQRSGRIITISSGSAFGDPGQPNYSAAKAGVLGLMWSTANALDKYGVTCNAVMPTGATRMIDATPRGKKFFEETGRHLSEASAGTESDPDNVAPLVTYLASDQAGWINGQIFHSFGFGYTLVAPPEPMARLRADRRLSVEELAALMTSTLRPDLPPRPPMPFGRGLDECPDGWREIERGAHYWRRGDKS